jgi:hypothetical protein
LSRSSQSKSLLRFEHLIQINDPADPGLPLMSRETLWQGLVYRARYPAHFNPALHSTLEPVSDISFVRVLSAGDMHLRDQVTLVPETEIRTLIDGDSQPIHAESITRIEEPQPGFLFVRFIYCRDSISDQGGLDADEFLKSAYLQNDREAIAMLRQMIADGWSGRPA